MVNFYDSLRPKEIVKNVKLVKITHPFGKDDSEFYYHGKIGGRGRTFTFRSNRFFPLK